MVKSTEGHVYFTDVDDPGKISPVGGRDNRFDRDDSNDHRSSRSVEYSGKEHAGNESENGNGIVIEITPQMRKYLKNLNTMYPDTGGYEIIKGSSSNESSYSSSGDSDENKDHIHASGQRIREKPRKRHRWSQNNQSSHQRGSSHSSHQREKTKSNRSRNDVSDEHFNQDRSDRRSQSGFPESSLGAIQDLLHRKTMNALDYKRLTGRNGNTYDDDPTSGDFSRDGIIREENKSNYNSKNKSKRRPNKR